MTDPVTLLQDADPASRLEVEPPEDVLRRIVAEPRPTGRRFASRRPLVLAVGLAAIAAASAGILPSVLSRDGVGDLAARAYAATALEDQIRHYRTETEYVFSGTGKHVEGDRYVDGPYAHRSSTFTEAWQYGDEVHWIVGAPNGSGGTSEHYLGKDDVIRTTLRQPGKEDQHQTVTPDFSAETRDIIDGMRGSFVERFRSFYREDRLRDEGRTTFAGRPAQRYVVERPGQRADFEGERRTARADAEFFIDAETALPLGRTDHTRVYDRNGKLTQDSRLTERVIVIDQLPPTPENLAKVRAP
jgi:hypothetical protein